MRVGSAKPLKTASRSPTVAAPAGFSADLLRTEMDFVIFAIADIMWMHEYDLSTKRVTGDTHSA